MTLHALSSHEETAPEATRNGAGLACESSRCVVAALFSADTPPPDGAAAAASTTSANPSRLRIRTAGARGATRAANAAFAVAMRRWRGSRASRPAFCMYALSSSAQVSASASGAGIYIYKYIYIYYI